MAIKLLKYRGHIRNWRSLCEELSIETSLSREKREKEILIKSNQNWGTDLGNHIYGMFALAIQDGEKFVAIRDHFGTKPFYYYLTNKKELLYGTYIKDILSHPDFHKELNIDMLQLYLTLTYAGGENTFFKGLKKLMPGHYLIYEDEKLSLETYWSPQFHADTSKSPEEYADEVHQTLCTIMHEIKDEDESADAFLSSGVDSSYILAMSKDSKSCSCGYDDPRFDESPLAKKTAELLHRPNLRCLITPEDYFNEVSYLCRHMEQPLGDASAVVFSIACRNVASQTKLCYSGEGSDEFFGGYNIYRNAERYGDHLRNFYVGNTMIMNEDEKRELLLDYREGILPIQLVSHLYDELKDCDPLSQMMNIDINLWLEGDIFLNVDKMSTACGLEVRMPVTDPRIFDIASRIPPAYIMSDEQNKIIFRTAARKMLPEEIAFRKKLGFIVPIRYWLADPRYNKQIQDTLFGDTAAKFFSLDKLHEMFDDYISGNSDLWRKIWTIYIFLVWYDIYF